MNFLLKVYFLILIFNITDVRAQFSIAQPETKTDTLQMIPLNIENNWWTMVENEYENDQTTIVLGAYLDRIKTMVEESESSKNLTENIDRVTKLLKEWKEKYNSDQLAPELIYQENVNDSSIEFLLGLNSQRIKLDTEIKNLILTQKEFEVLTDEREKEINNLKVSYNALADPTIEKLTVELTWIETKIQQEIEKSIIENIITEIKTKKSQLESLEKEIEQANPVLEFNEENEKQLTELKEKYENLNEKIKNEKNQLQEQIRKTPIEQNKNIRNEFRILNLSADLSIIELEIISLNTSKILSDLESAEDLKRRLYIDNEKALDNIIDNIERWSEKTNSFFNNSNDLSIGEISTEDQKLIEKTQEFALNLRTSISIIKAKLSETEIIQNALFKLISENNNITSGVYNLVLTSASVTIDSIVDFIYEPLFIVGDTPITLFPLIKLMIIILIGYLSTKLVTFLIHRHQKKNNTEYNSSLYLFHRIIHYLIFIIAIMAGLDTLGLNLANLTLIAGALSVGIGFGLQNIVSNFVSGLTIMIEKTLSVGDFIELDNGITGTVKAINARYTQINTNDNIDVIIPNADLVTNPVINWTLKDSLRRIKIPFGVAYGTERSLVEKAGMEAAENVEFTINNSNRKPFVCITGFGDSCVDYLLLIWVSTKGLYKPNRMMALYYHELEDKLKNYNIEIPFPQRDVNLINKSDK